MRNDSVISRNRAVIKRGNLLEDESKVTVTRKDEFSCQIPPLTEEIH